MPVSSGVLDKSGVLDRLTADIDALVEADPAVLADPETIVALNRQLERLSAVNTRATATFDASRAWDGDGARTAAAWLAVWCRLPMPTARARVRLGRDLRHLGTAEAAWLDGDVGEAQVTLLGRARTPATEEALVRDEAMLVGEAARLRFGSFARVLTYWAQRADPDGADGDARAQHDGRRLHLSQSLDGMWFLDGVVDPLTGAIVVNELKRLEAKLFQADWTEARDRLGDNVGVDDLARTHKQRRADALAEMARRSATAPADGRRPEPLISVLVGYETFAAMMCELADGTVITAGSLRGCLDEAWVERVVFDGPSRVIDVGVPRRLFSGATRRAIELRDRECFHPYCDTPAADCEMDHDLRWSEGGPTTTDNGRPACPFHNRARERAP